ncbi:MAG: hypothetical protein RIA08_13285 [Roseovarius sp.]|uniref:hypothetical protein n=1 Tax=Roseovarius sp. TaxID=1486281 RepID=UPI0032EC2224
MDYIQKAQERYTEKPHVGRSTRARRWARTVFALLIFACLFGIWQERALAPPVHDGMHSMVDHVIYAMENSDDIRGFVKQTFGSPSGTSVQQEFDPITRWLLKWTS